MGTVTVLSLLWDYSEGGLLNFALEKPWNSQSSMCFHNGNLADENTDNADYGGPACIVTDRSKHSIETWDESIHVIFWLESGCACQLEKKESAMIKKRPELLR